MVSIIFSTLITLSISQIDIESARTSLAGISTAGAIAISSPDVALARSVLYSPHVRGSFGESHMHRYLAQYLKEKNLRHVPVRLGRQGIDGIYVKYMPDGTPNSLIVSEAKYGSSSLKMTKTGIQLGKTWSNVRLEKIGNEYLQIAKTINNKNMVVGKIPQQIETHRLQVNLPNGKAAVCWRAGSNDPWKFAGPEKLLESAGIQYQKMSTFFYQAARGDIPYERILYRIKIKDNILNVTVKDAFLIDKVGSEGLLPKKFDFTYKLRPSNLVAFREIIEKNIAADISRMFPNIPKSEVDVTAKNISKNVKDIEKLLTLTREGFFKQSLNGALVAGGAVALLDGVLQVSLGYYFEKKVDMPRLIGSVGLSFLSGGSGYLAGQYASASLINSNVLDSIIKPGTSIYGTTARTLAANELSSIAGGSVAVALFAYGSYLMGYTDIDTAHRSAIIGLSGVGVGALAGVGITSAVVFFGTTGTGVAISSLSGAALTTSTMAFLGGGSIAAGGFGAAGGAIVLTGGTAIIAISTGILVHYAFKMYDQKQEKDKINITMNYFKEFAFFAKDSTEEFISNPNLIKMRNAS